MALVLSWWQSPKSSPSTCRPRPLSLLSSFLAPPLALTWFGLVMPSFLAPSLVSPWLPSWIALHPSSPATSLVTLWWGIPELSVGSESRLFIWCSPWCSLPAFLVSLGFWSPSPCPSSSFSSPWGRPGSRSVLRSIFSWVSLPLGFLARMFLFLAPLLALALCSVPPCLSSSVSDWCCLVCLAPLL